MTEIDEKTLLSEAKAGYNHQLSNWNELDHKFQNFLRLNGLLLTMIFIGIGFIGMNSIIESIKADSINKSFIFVAFVFLFFSVCSIFYSTLRSFSSVRDVSVIKEIDVNLYDDNDPKNKERDTFTSLIEKYDLARGKIIKNYDKRKKYYQHVRKSFFISLWLLVLFLFIFMCISNSVIGSIASSDMCTDIKLCSSLD